MLLFQDLEAVVAVRTDRMEIEERGDGYRLSARVLAVPIPSGRPLLDIKAPTYSQMRVDPNDHWTIEAGLDV